MGGLLLLLPQRASDKIAEDGNIDNLNEHRPMRNTLVELEQLLIHSNIPVSIMLVSLISAGHIVSTQSICCYLYLAVLHVIMACSSCYYIQFIIFNLCYLVISLPSVITWFDLANTFILLMINVFAWIIQYLVFWAVIIIKICSQDVITL